MGAGRSAQVPGGCEEDYGKDAGDDNASYCSYDDAQPDVGRIDSMQSSQGESPIVRGDTSQSMCSLPSDATGETTPAGAENAATRGAENSAISSFEVRLARTGGAAWGFAWNVGAYAAKRLLVAGVDPSSPAGRWSSEERERSARAIERGDELVSVNGITENGAMRRELVSADEVHLIFQPVAEGGVDNRRPKLGPMCRPAPIAPPTPPPQAVPSSDSNLGRDAPVCIKNTFLHVSEKEEHHEDDFSRSDPFPISQLGGAMKHSPYTPGCLAGVNLPAHIAKMAHAAGGEGLDRSGSSYSGWSTAQSKSSSNSMSGDERGPQRGGDRHWPSTSSENDFPCSPHMGSFSGSRPLYPTAEVPSPASTSSSLVSPAKVAGNVAASVEAAAAAASPAASPTHLAPALTFNFPAGDETPGDEVTRTGSQSIDSLPTSLSSPPKAPAMKIKNTFIELEEPEETEFDFNDTCKTAPVFHSPGLLATPVGKKVDVLMSLNERNSKEEVTDAHCPEAAVDASTDAPPEPARLSPELLEANASQKARGIDEVASPLESARAASELRDWEGVPKAAMKIKNTFVEFVEEDDPDSEFGDTLKTMPDLWRPGLLASPKAAPSMNLLAATTTEEPATNMDWISPEKPTAGMQLTPFASPPAEVQRPQMEEYKEQVAKDSGSADEDGEDAANDSAGNQEGVEGEVAPKRRKPTRRAGRRARHRRHHAAEARRLAEEAAAAEAAGGASGCVGETAAEVSGAAAKDAGPNGHTASQSRNDKESIVETGSAGAETGQGPTRRGGRPPKKSQLAAAAAKSVSGVAATPDTNGLGLGGDAATPVVSVTPTSSPSRAVTMAATGSPAQDSGEATGGSRQDQREDITGADLLGKRVLIQGLVRQPQFNGEWGKVESYDPGLQRFAVRILQDAGQGVLAKLRRENLVVPQTLSLKFNDESRGFVPEQSVRALDATASPTASADAGFVQSVAPAPAAPSCSARPSPVLQLDELVSTVAWSGAEVVAAGAAAEKWRPTLRPLSS